MSERLERVSESVSSFESSAPSPSTPASVEQRVSEGRVIKIRGGVVDVLFNDPVPRIQDLVYAGELAMEVAALLDQSTVRCIALAPVRGLGLGMPVYTTGAPIQVPVGEAVLGRMLNVFGEAIDGLPAPAAVAVRSIHQARHHLC